MVLVMPIALTTLNVCIMNLGHKPLRWVKAGFFCGEDYWPQKVYACYCIVVDNVNKQIGFHGNAPPTCKQRPLIKAALTLCQPMRCRIFLITRQS